MTPFEFSQITSPILALIIILLNSVRDNKIRLVLQCLVGITLLTVVGRAITWILRG